MDTLSWARDHWPVIPLSVVLALVGGYFAWRIWRGAHIAEAARVDDARSGVNLAR